VHALEVGEMTFNPSEENSCQDVTQKEEKKIIDFPSYPREWETDLRESLLHPGQCKKDGPQGGCRKAELVEKEVAEGVVSLFVDGSVSLLVSQVKGLLGQAVHLFDAGIELVQMSLVDPKNNRNRQLSYQDRQQSQQKGPQVIVYQRMAR
jgi:hypothetical protein